MQVLKYINVLHLITKVQLIILKIRIFKTLFQKALHKIGGLFDENFIINLYFLWGKFLKFRAILFIN